MVTFADLSLCRFSKMHDAGDDFVVPDLRETEEPSPELCRILADRHMGVGCDLIFGIYAPRSPDAVASYCIWTGDGEPSRQCGSGTNAAAAAFVCEGQLDVSHTSYLGDKS